MTPRCFRTCVARRINPHRLLFIWSGCDDVLQAGFFLDSGEAGGVPATP